MKAAPSLQETKYITVGMKAEIEIPEWTIENEIEQGATRRVIAQTYTLALRKSKSSEVDWKRINEAIIERWSLSGLEWIKNQAWSGKCFNE